MPADLPISVGHDRDLKSGYRDCALMRIILHKGKAAVLTEVGVLMLDRHLAIRTSNSGLSVCSYCCDC